MKAERDHDRDLELALKQALGSGDPLPPSKSCLDAETLAAWMDHGLDAPAVARAEAHVSSCRRCQALVGAMAHLTPPQDAEAATRAPSWRWWLAPLAVGAAAATLWMVVPDEQYVAPFTSPVGEVAQAPSAPTEPGSPEAGMSVPPPPAEASADAAENTARKAGDPDALGRAESTPAGTSPSSSETAARAREQAAEAQVQAAAPAPSAMRQEQAVSRDIVSPDPAVRWRIGVDGTVDRTTDGGGAWERLDSGLAAGIAAGSAPSPDVCWLVGRGGLVLVTSDGRDFTRVAFPEAIDLTGVQASDARTAVVTTVDGRVFATADGGASWRQRD